MAAVGTSSGREEMIRGVDGVTDDVGRKFTPLLPAVVAPDIAVFTDLKLRDMLARERGLHRSASSLRTQLESRPPPDLLSSG